MKELIGHLGALDSDASESLKAVAYFDRLLEERAGLETFVRGAAALTGCVAGISDPRTLSVRCAPTGNRLSVGAARRLTGPRSACGMARRAPSGSSARATAHRPT